jgi:hypothetical protein
MPRATGDQRISWAQVPVELAGAIGRLLGSQVVTADSQPGGFSEGLAARVQLADGRRAFVKAVSAVSAPAAAEFHRREMSISAELVGTGMVPQLLGGYDDGVWVALAPYSARR